MKDNCTLTKVYSFSAAHRLHNEKFSDEENREIFGKCNNPNGHGHDYSLELTIGGEVDEKTGMIIDIVKHVNVEFLLRRKLCCMLPITSLGKVTINYAKVPLI